MYIFENYDGGVWKEVELIGKGTFGEVYKIRKVEYGVEFVAALKVVPIPHSDSELKEIRAECSDEKAVLETIEEMTAGIMNEVQVMVNLRGHKNIVAYEDFKVLKKEKGIGNYVIIRMELLKSLDSVAASGLEVEKCLKLGKDICAALEWMKSRKIIHRDIKPANIMVLGSNTYKLGDFGIAKQMSNTLGGHTITGTPNYMAPEIFNNQPYGALVDIYSLGIVMYRLMNQGRLPFYPPYPNRVTATDKEVADKKRFTTGERPPYPSNADRELGEIILKACAFRKKDRYQTATEFRVALENYEKLRELKARSGESSTIKPVIPGDSRDREATVQPKSGNPVGKGTPSGQKSGNPAASGASPGPKSGNPAASGASPGPKSGNPAASGVPPKPKNGNQAGQGASPKPKSGNPAASGAPSGPKSGNPAASGASPKPKSGNQSGQGASPKPKSGNQSGQGASPKPKNGNPAVQGVPKGQKSGSQAGQGASPKPQNVNPAGQGASPKPKSGNQAGQGASPKPKNVNQASQGASPKPKNVNQAGQGASPKPQNVNQAGQGASPKPQNVNPAGQGASPKPQNVNLTGQGASPLPKSGNQSGQRMPPEKVPLSGTIFVDEERKSNPQDLNEDVRKKAMWYEEVPEQYDVKVILAAIAAIALIIIIVGLL